MNPATFLNYLDEFLGSAEVSNFQRYSSQLSAWSNVFWVIDNYLLNLKSHYPWFYAAARLEFVLLLDLTSKYAVERTSDDKNIHFYCLLQLTQFCKCLKSNLIDHLALKIVQFPHLITEDLVFSDYYDFFNEIYDPLLHCYKLNYLSLVDYFFAPKDYFVYTCLDWLTERNLYRLYDIVPSVFFDF
jgi:hypothetical protein